MKKLFTLAVAVLASFSLMAEDITFVMAEIFDGSNQTAEVTEPVAATVTTTASKSNAKTGKLGSDGNYFEIVLADETFAAVSLNGYINTSSTDKNWAFQFSTDGGASWSAEETQANDGDKTSHDIAVEADVPAGANGFRVVRRAGTSTVVNSITLSLGSASVEPVLNVNPAEVELAASFKNPIATAVVTFSGKNLKAGEYALTVPNLVGLSVEPTAVTVGENGRLNQEVTLTFAPENDVEAASTKLSLTIEDLTKEVTVNYSASMTVVKNFLKESVNIEQLVLDYGTGYDIASTLTAANIEFENIDALDSLNDAKTARNEPYLGLKLKKQGAYIACWIKAGDRIAVKFGAIKEAVKIGVNGEFEELAATDEGTSIERTATVDEYLVIETKSSKTVVIKQIMLNQDIQEVVLPGDAQGIRNTEISTKAVKRIIDGQLVIEKNGKLYDVTGAEIK